MNNTLYALNNYIHIGLGSLALLGGLVALGTAKGSSLHIRGGKVFAWTMIFVVITTLIAMFHEFLPLAVVLAISEVYLVPSALLSVNRRYRHFVAINRGLMVIVGLLFLFAAIQFVRINLVAGQFFVGPLVLTAMFGFLFVQDWRMLRHRPGEPNFWLRRHLVRMILAFTVAVMALVRIGTNFGLSLEASVVLPLMVATIAITWTYRRYPLRSHSKVATAEQIGSESDARARDSGTGL